MSKEVRITCPGCRMEGTALLWDTIDATFNQEEKRRLLDGQLFYHYCAGCGKATPIEYPCVYHDGAASAAVLFFPEGDGTHDEMIPQPPEGSANLRRVRSALSLAEKVRILDGGRDDRVIEVMKLLYVSRLKKERPEAQVQNVLYEKQDGVEQLVFILKGEGNLVSDIQPVFYERVAKDFEERIQKATPDGWAEIDGHWALAVLKNG